MLKEELSSCKAVGKLVQELRRAQGVTQAQLAGLANTGVRFVGDLENGKETCQIGKMLRVPAAPGAGIHIYGPYNRE